MVAEYWCVWLQGVTRWARCFWCMHFRLYKARGTFFSTISLRCLRLLCDNRIALHFHKYFVKQVHSTAIMSSYDDLPAIPGLRCLWWFLFSLRGNIGENSFCITSSIDVSLEFYGCCFLIAEVLREKRVYSLNCWCSYAVVYLADAAEAISIPAGCTALVAVFIFQWRRKNSRLTTAVFNSCCCWFSIIAKLKGQGRGVKAKKHAAWLTHTQAGGHMQRQSPTLKYFL